MIDKEPKPEGRPPFFYGYIVVVAAVCIMIVSFGTRNSYGIFFKPMSAEFDWSRAITSGAFSISAVMEGLLGIVMGGLTDKFGPRLVMTVSGILLGAGYILMSQIHAAWHLYLVYGVVIGIGLGGMFVPLMSTVARWFVRRRTVMTGAVISGQSIGALIIPPMTQNLITTLEWRATSMILGGMVLIVIIVAALFLRRDPAKMYLTPYGEGKQEENRPSSRIPEFTFKQALFTRQLWLFFFMLVCYGFCAFSILVHIVPHSTDIDISATSAASLLSIFGGASIVGMVVLGSSADRIGNKRVIVTGFILLSAALFWLVPASNLWMLYLFAAVFGFAYGGVSCAESPLVAELFGLGSHGLIFGLLGLGFTIGAAVGPFLTGYIFDTTESYRLAFLISGALSIVALVLAILLKPIKGEKLPVPEVAS